MEQTASAGGQVVTMLITFLLIGIPFAFLNAAIAKRKGKNRLLCGIFSIFMIVNIFIAIYLISLPDKELVDIVAKLNTVLEKEQERTQ